MLDILIQADILGKLIKTSIDLNSYISASSGLVKQLGMCSLTATYHRRKKLYLLTLRKRHDLIYHLIHCLFPDLSAALRTMRDSHTGIQKAEIIIDLSYRSHSRTGIPVR